MTDALASFRELKGVGPATERRLHDAGVYTWSALADVLAALSGTRRADPLRDLSDQVAARSSTADENGNPHLADGERAEAFVLRMALATDGRPLRSAVTHVRSQDERLWNGWSPAGLVGFVEERAGVVAGEVAPAASADDGPPRPSTDHVVVLDAGKAIGGRRRSIALQVSTDQLGDVDEVDYRATLVGRALGSGEVERELGRRVGRAHPPTTLPLRFDAVDLPPGVQRLRLRVALRLPSQRQEAPVLELR